MYLGRHYIKKGKWIAAMRRFQYILEEYDQTIFVEEAIHRLVEINYKIGLLEESQKYANLLGTIIFLVNGMKNHIKFLIRTIKYQNKKKLKKKE